MSGMTEEFGSMVFSDAVMQQRLPAEIYSALRSARQYGKRLTLAEADVVAEAMRDWAIERGATHYTHWFQPHDRHHRRKARQLSLARRATARVHHGVFRQGADPGRAGRLVASPPAVCAPPLRRAATPPGTRPPTLLSRTARSASPRRSAPTAARRWIRKRRCCARMDALNSQAMRILQLFGEHCRQRVRADTSARSRSIF